MFLGLHIKFKRIVCFGDTQALTFSYFQKIALGLLIGTHTKKRACSSLRSKVWMECWIKCSHLELQY